MKLVILTLLFALSWAQNFTQEKGSQSLGLGMNILTLETYLPVFELKWTEKNENVDSDSILPDHVVEYVLPTNSLSTYADVIDEMTNYTDTISIHLEGNANFWMIKASFSGDYNRVQDELSQTHHKVATVGARVTLSMLTADIHQMKFSSGFEDLVYRMSYSVDKGTPAALELGRYYANEIIRLHGTHVIFKLLRGASVNQIVTIDTNKLTNYNKETFKGEASASLSTFFSMKGSYQRDTSQSASYQRATTNVQVFSRGGASWHTDWTYNNWIDTVKQNPAIVDQYLIPLSDLIIPHRFPNVTAKVIQSVLEVLNDAVYAHADQNTHRGCMDPSSTSYSYRANLDDEAACLYNMQLSYGGSYQISSLGSYTLNNMITQKTSCPTGFDSYPLMPQTNGVYTQGEDPQTCVKKCQGGSPSPLKNVACGVLCREKRLEYHSYTVQSFVCLAKNTSEHGVYFGGAFTSALDNVVTGAKRCPDTYTQRTLYYGIILCEAPFDSGKIDSGVRSGGFFTSTLPNLYTGAFFCPMGYERHSLGRIMDGNEFVYCIGLNDLSGRQEFVPAGFGDPYPSFVEKHYINNDTYYLVQIDLPDSYEEQVKKMEVIVTPDMLAEEISSEETGTVAPVEKSTTGFIVAIVILSVAVVALIVGVIYLRRRWSYGTI